MLGLCSAEGLYHLCIARLNVSVTCVYTGGLSSVRYHLFFLKPPNPELNHCPLWSMMEFYWVFSLADKTVRVGLVQCPLLSGNVRQTKVCLCKHAFRSKESSVYQDSEVKLSSSFQEVTSEFLYQYKTVRRTYFGVSTTQFSQFYQLFSRTFHQTHWLIAINEVRTEFERLSHFTVCKYALVLR